MDTYYMGTTWQVNTLLRETLPPEGGSHGSGMANQGREDRRGG